MKPLDPLSLDLRGLHLIEASAGTGKTHTIATLFVRLVLERRLRPDRILVVTFTNAATAELRDRIRKRLRDALTVFELEGVATDETLSALFERSRDRERDRAHLERALHLVDHAAVHTIHGFCQLALSEQAFECGVRAEFDLLADISPVLDEIIHDFWSARVGSADRAQVEYLAQRKLGPDSLFQLALRAVRAPDAPIVVDAGPWDPRALSGYLECKQRASREWMENRTAVSALLRSSPALSRNSYRLPTCDRIVASMDALASSDETSLGPVSEDLVKLTPGNIRSAVKKGHHAPHHPFFDTCERLMQERVAAEAALGAWSQKLLGDFAVAVRAELTRRTADRSQRHFDGLLHSLRSALGGPRGKVLSASLRARFPAALIDEFHDTDPVQYEIFRRVYSTKGTGLFLIGDPKQAIYAFRGADVFAYLAAASAVTSRHTLATNYRSDPAMIRAVNTLFSRPKAPFVMEDIRFEAVSPSTRSHDRLTQDDTAGSGLDIVLLRRPRAEPGKRPQPPSRDAVADVIADDIVHLLGSTAKIDGRAVAAKDVAVLTRTNLEAEEIQRALWKRDVPAVFHGDTSVLDTDESSELAHVLRALANPSSSAHVRAALATPLFGLNASELFAMGEDEATWEHWTEAFARWHGVWEARGFLSAARVLMQEHRMSARLLATVGGERKLTNLRHLIELCHRQADEFRLGVAGLLTWFDEVRHDKEARQGLSGDQHQIRLESDADAVELTTMHRSKGLEYPIVYLPYLWKSSRLFSRDRDQLAYHEPAQRHALVLDLRPENCKPEQLALAETEAMAESLRLAYVALTRARHRTVMLWGGFTDFHLSAAARLLHPTLTSLDALEAASDDVLLTDLADLASSAGGAVTVRDPRGTPGAKLRKVESMPPRSLAAATPQRALSVAFRTSSFSSLIANRVLAADDGKDVDAHSEAAPLVTSPAARVPLDEFPRGPRVGDALHVMLEQADFRSEDDVRRVVREQLDTRGMSPDRWALPLSQALWDVLRTRLLPDRDLSLHRIAPDRRLSEMEFVFPVRNERSGGGLLTSSQLADALAANPLLPRDYVERVRGLAFAPLVGFMRGFIDLVFEHEGRFYVVDYKSNHLGPSASDYEVPRLMTAMGEHHYFLQYHLYSLAVHRYLATRLAGYTHAKHFGGVLYLFVRGIASERGCATGVFVYGRSLSGGLPTVITPGELDDGAVVSGQYGHPALKNPTYLHQTHPVVAAVRACDDLELAALVLCPEPVDQANKELISAHAARLCVQLGLDAAIVTKEGGGNADADVTLKLDRLEEEGVTAVGILGEMAGRDGTGPPLVVAPTHAAAIASTGNYDERMTLPATDRALGRERVALLDQASTDELELPVAVIYCALSTLGWGRLTCAEAAA